MLKIVIDTNVLVSALIQKSYPHFIVQTVLETNNLQVCVSKELLDEYYEVLARPKFSRFTDFHLSAKLLLVNIETKAKLFEPSLKLNLISDKDENMIIELDDECLADYIITGNSTDFTFPIYKNTKIVSPKEFWEEMLNKKYEL
jgi:putative PIN family toxin of toxin-antitoxin system